MDTPSLDLLSHEISKLPGIGPRTATRLAYFILESPRQNVEKLCAALLQVKDRVRECPQCFSYTESEGPCRLCLDPQRDHGLLCVVEDPADTLRLDSSGAFRGLYHVLHGSISPLEGVGPEDLKIKELLGRVRRGKSGDTAEIKEIILALDADLEGDTTALYLSQELAPFGIKLTRLAQGVPIGGDIDYIDHRTLGRALENRVEV